VRPVEKLLIDLAKEWRHESRPKLQVIGSTALMLRTDYHRGTKDSDILHAAHLDEETCLRLVELAGRGTKLAERWRMYVQIVSNGLPFLPQAPKWHSVSIEGASHAFVIEALDVVDVVVSKLKRFHGDDQTDIAAMVDRDLVPHDLLLGRFRSAMEMFSYDARAEELPRYIANLHQVERDMLLVEETELELPDWVE
jgi:hypothetical protein